MADLKEYTKDKLGVRLQPTIWIGLAAVAAYLILAAGLGNIITIWFPTGTELGDYALSHFIPLPVLIIGGLLFIRWAGWSKDVRRATPAHKQQPKRKWLYSIPILLLIQGVLPLFVAPWGEVSFIFFIVSLLATALVGIGEELYFRGILRVSLQAYRSAFLTLVVTSVLFGLGHMIGELFEGLPAGAIAFQISVLAMNGVLYFGAFLATGRLWVVMVLHFLADFGLHMNGGFGSRSEYEPGTATIVVSIMLSVLAAALIISAIRQDIEARRKKTA